MIPDDSWWLWAVLISCVAISVWLEQTRIGRLLAAPTIAISLGIVLANSGILPTASQSYEVIGQYVVATSIPLLLLRGNLRRIFRDSGITFYAFVLGTVCTIAGTLLAFYVVPMDRELAAQLAGAFAATYIGGSMNFVAVSQAVGVTPETFAVGVAADNLVGTVYIVLLALLPTLGLVRRMFKGPRALPGAASAVAPADETLHIRPAALAGALALAVVIAATATLLGKMTRVDYAPVLISTAIAVTVATLFPKVETALAGALELGLLGMLLFFVTVGAGASLAALADHGLVVLLFAAIIVATHLAILLPTAAALRLPLRETLIGSCSNITGPAVSAAVSAARGWHDLVVPGVLTGLLGYIIATFIGIALKNLLS